MRTRVCKYLRINYAIVRCFLPEEVGIAAGSFLTGAGMTGSMAFTYSSGRDPTISNLFTTARVLS